VAEKLTIRKYFLVCCEGVSSISNPGRLAIRNCGKYGCKRNTTDLGVVSGELWGAKCALIHAIFDRLEKFNALFSGELRAILIAELSIRKWRVKGVAGLDCSGTLSVPAVQPAAALRRNLARAFGVEFVSG
jgi:hypothetical protein